MLGSSAVDWVPDDFRDIDNDGADDVLQGIAYFSVSQILGTGDLEKKIGVAKEVQQLIGNGEVMRILGEIDLGPQKESFYDVDGSVSFEIPKSGKMTFEVTQ